MATCIVKTGNSSGVNVRVSKETNSKKLGVIDNGVYVDVVRCNDTWATLMYNSTPAFVQHKFLQNPPSTNGDGLSVNAYATCNGNSVNVRKAANGSTVITQINKGTNYKVLGKSLTGGYYWYQIDTNQWVRGDYLTPNSSGSSGGGNTGTSVDDYHIQATIDTVTHGVGGTVKLRAEASQNADVVTTIPDRSTIYVKSLSGTWLAAKYNNSYFGYIMAEFVVGSDVYKGSNSGSNGGSTDGDTITYTFSATDAVTYAMNHSDNTTGVACPKRNTTFSGIDGDNDCADFVSQCLCAGGVPMFDGWFYSISGIPSSWKDSKWSVTYGACKKLEGKGWLETVSYDAIEPGDIIYTYQANAKPTPYTHVTIAVSSNLTEDGVFGCRVCGYTKNQHNKFKKLTDSNCQCYRVKKTFSGDGSEKSVFLPPSGNGATVR